jgi:hypothetical protein
MRASAADHSIHRMLHSSHSLIACHLLLSVPDSSMFRGAMMRCAFAILIVVVALGVQPASALLLTQGESIAFILDASG